MSLNLLVMWGGSTLASARAPSRRRRPHHRADPPHTRPPAAARPRHRLRNALVGTVVALAGTALTLWVGLLVFLNISLPLIVNRQPERIRMTYDLAWVRTSGEVEVHNLEVRQQSPKDQFLLHVDRGVGFAGAPARMPRRPSRTRASRSTRWTR